VGKLRWLRAALAGALGGVCVLLCFADVFFGPYLWNRYCPNPPVAYVLAMAGGAATLALAAALAWPGRQRELIRVLAVTAFVYLVFRPVAMPWSQWLMTLGMTPTAQYWLVSGPGGGILGLLPSTIALLLGGRYLFGMSIREQWGGRLTPAVRDLVYGGGIGVLWCAIFLGGLAISGYGRLAWEPNLARDGANLFSNLYEELLARGLLLAVTRKVGGKWFGMLWTSVVFGSMHSFGWFALGIAMTAWVMAWVILKAGSVWAGWVLHQVTDMIMDSWMH
jgi:membrane protease YdiL (CAAX protease family)